MPNTWRRNPRLKLERPTDLLEVSAATYVLGDSLPWLLSKLIVRDGSMEYDTILGYSTSMQRSLMPCKSLSMPMQNLFAFQIHNMLSHNP